MTMSRAHAVPARYLTGSIVALAGALLSLAAVAPSSALAQDERWEFNITPYLWVPKVDSNLGVPDLATDVEADAGSSDFLDELEFALLVCGEVRKGKLGLVYDFQYLKLGDDGTTGIIDRAYDTDLAIGDATLGLEYRIFDNDELAVDTILGARGFYTRIDIDLDATSFLAANSGDDDKFWVDPIIGLKCHYRMGRHWRLFGYADVGGCVSSDLTYQVMGTVGYFFNDHIGLQAGYRYFVVDYDDGGFKIDADMYGPLVGLTFIF